MIRKYLFLVTAPLALAACGGVGGGGPVLAGQAAPISQQERTQGNEANPSILAEFGGAYEGPQASYTTRVGQKIAVQSGLSASPDAFDVTLLNSPVNNAFAIPGGYVYVTRQLMALMNSEAELAAVLGHEVAHVAARHSAKRQSTAQRNSILGVLGQVLVGAVAGQSQIGSILSEGIGTGSQLLTLGYSRGQETQSDDLAIEYLVKAGYDPAALSAMLSSLALQNRLDQQIAGNARSVPEWASTHPDPASRVQRAATRAAATGAVGGLLNREQYLAAIDGLIYGEDPSQGVIEGNTFTHPGFRLAFDIPQGFTMQNGTTAVIINGPNVRAQFSTARYDGNLEGYVNSILNGIAAGAGNNATVRRTTVNGVPSAFSQIRANSGNAQVDVTVYAYAPSSSTAYHFITQTPSGQGLGAMNSMVQSFRTLSASQAAAVTPKYVRVVTVRSGDTPSSLAQRMAFDDYKLERFLVLNALDQNSVLRAGQKVKIISN